MTELISIFSTQIEQSLYLASSTTSMENAVLIHRNRKIKSSSSGLFCVIEFRLFA